MSPKPPTASGLRILYPPNKGNTNQSLDIIAIHGIGADADRTWTGRGPAGETVNWLADSNMLPKALPNARIMRFGYESNWFGAREDAAEDAHPPKKTFVSQVANMLLEELEWYRRGITCPIIFIAHSYGGLVLIQALRSSFDRQEKWLNPFGHTAGLVFFGTPFRGRQGLSLGQMVELIAEADPEITVYEDTMALSVEENPYLEDIVFRFTETRLDRPIPISCFYETMPSPVGRVLRNSRVKDGYVVPEHSACLDTSKGIERKPLERNHYNLQKFPGPEDMGYRAVEKEIISLARGYGTPCGDTKELKTIKNHLYFNSMELRFRSVKNVSRCAGSDWLHNTRQFKNWDALLKPTFLVLAGKAGSGKSSVMKLAVEKLIAQGPVERQIVVHYFFDGSQNEDYLVRSAEGMYRSILHQLINNKMAVPKEWTDQFANLDKRSMCTVETLKEAIEGIIAHYTKESVQVRVLLDALDECKEQGDIIEMLDFFVNLTKDRRAPEHSLDVKVFLSTRYHQDLAILGPEILTDSIVAQDHNEENLREYVCQELKFMENHSRSQTARDNLQNLIVRRSEGVFLWASLVVQDIKQRISHTTPTGVIDAVFDLITQAPKKLAHIYENRLGRDTEITRKTIKLFQLMTFGQRSFTLSEMKYAWALWTAPGTAKSDFQQSLNEINSTEVGTFQNQLSRAMLGLVEFRPYRPHDTITSGLAEKDTLVVFIHETVRAYLIDKGLVKIDPTLETSVSSLCHWSILQLCLKVMEFSDKDNLVFPEVAQMENHARSLQNYACCYWMKHGRESDAYIPHDFNFPRDILQCKGRGAKLIGFYRSFRKWNPAPNDLLIENEEEMFVLLAAEGCGQLAIKHVERCRSIQSCLQSVGTVDDTSATPPVFDRALFQAVVNGQFETVKRFRRHGLHKFDPNRIVGKWNAIYKACYLGQHEMVQELLDMGADVLQPVKGGYKTALHAAAACNSSKVIDIIFSHPSTSTDNLLTLRAKINRIGRGVTALHVAVVTNSANAAKALLEHIDRSSQREMYHAIRTDEGETAADMANMIAVSQNNADMKELLEEYLE